ncbi:MAG TPA: Ig-like domain-containing protein [Mycobacteriales bacterium]|nr:Ig-like domain-containing protein [Mycobacteriales bacterium]
MTVARRAGRGPGLFGLAAGGLALALLSACSSPSGAAEKARTAANLSQGSGSGAGRAAPSAPATPAAAPARVGVRPGQGARGVSPVTPILVAATGGTLHSVTVTNPAGERVTGAFSADRTRWTSSEDLGYSRTYTVSAVATNVDGHRTATTSRFTTLTPANLTMPTVTPNGGTFGVGEPVVVRFDEPIGDRVAAERALVVDTAPTVYGVWHWFGDREAHWRPEKYWAPGTRVTVHANVYGVNLGNGLYGQADRTGSFTVGASKIAVIDDHTHMMRVTVNGRKAHPDIPVSMGRGGCITVNGNHICFTTQSGPHVVLGKTPVKHMSSASYGLPVNSPLGYSEDIALAVRISWSGEFVHSAPWSVADQGRRNVSHGCINISAANARWFYHTFGVGDVVDIRNTAVPLPPTDGYGDWVLSWPRWVAGSALA